MVDARPTQLSLGVSLHDDATFNNFYLMEQNASAVHTLKQLATQRAENNVVIWGPSGSGLSHLLQSTCHHAFHHGLSIQYLPMEEVLGFAPDQVCDGLESCELVCIDDVQLISGNPLWEKSLFHLYNRLRDQQHSLLLACHMSPASLPIGLPDFKSRILGSVVFQINELNDQQKSDALCMRARIRGMEMPEEVARYILARAPRTTGELFCILDVLDEASLQHQRKLTIPFVKSVLRF